MAISKIKVGNEEHDIVDNTHTLITLSADSGTLSASDLNKLKANPQKTIINCGGYYYYAENLTSSTTWYYSCNVYYTGSKIIKRVITITTSSGAYTKTDYEYTGGSIPDDLVAETLYVSAEIVAGEDDNIIINKNGIKVNNKTLATEEYVDNAIENAGGSGREITDPVTVQSTTIPQEHSTLTSDKLSLTDGDNCRTEYKHGSITREIFNVEDVNNPTKQTYSLPNKSGSLATEEYVDDAVANVEFPDTIDGNLNVKGRLNVKQSVKGSNITITSEDYDGAWIVPDEEDEHTPALVFYGVHGDEKVILRHIANPTQDDDVATKEYVDDSFTKIFVNSNGGTLSAENLAKVKENPYKTVLSIAGNYCFISITANEYWYYGIKSVTASEIAYNEVIVNPNTGEYSTSTKKHYRPTVDTVLNSTSTNPVQNKVIAQALATRVSHDVFNNRMNMLEDDLETKASKRYVDDAVANAKQMISLKYSDLKALRDSNSLIAGMFYRITDYQCTTVQEDTRAMNNKFDIIVQALSENTLSENASADYHYSNSSDATFIDSVIEYEPDGTLVVGSVTPCYFEYIDFGGLDGLTNEYRVDWSDVFIAFDYDMNDKGQSVPVIYKTDEAGVGEDADPEFSDPDYADIFYYEGNAEIDGVTYNKWRKINYDGTDENELNWDSLGKIYLYTNVIVEGGGVTVDGIQPSQANIPAWELKYCLDNDTTRFAWAADFEGQAITNLDSYESNGRPLTRQPIFDGLKTDYPEYVYAWGVYEDVESGDTTNFIYSKTEIVTSGDTVYDANRDMLSTAEVTNGGKGVIYYMKDEHNIECPYDFKNIQFKRDEGWQNTHQDFCDSIYLNTQEEWFYTFTWLNSDLKCEDLTLRQDLKNDELLTEGTHHIKIGSYKDERNCYNLPNNVFIATYDCDGGMFYGMYNITVGDYCLNNTFGEVTNIHFGNKCDGNIIGGYCQEIYFSHGCYDNTIGFFSADITLGNGTGLVSMANETNDVTIGNNCSNISMGGFSQDIIIGNECRYITFKHLDNSIAGKITRVKIGDFCERVNIMPDTKEFDGYIQDITLESGIRGTVASELIIDMVRDDSPVVYQPSVTYHTVS